MNRRSTMETAVNRSRVAYLDGVPGVLGVASRIGAGSHRYTSEISRCSRCGRGAVLVMWKPCPAPLPGAEKSHCASLEAIQFLCGIPNYDVNIL